MSNACPAVFVFVVRNTNFCAVAKFYLNDIRNGPVNVMLDLFTTAQRIREILKVADETPGIIYSKSPIFAIIHF